MQARTLGMETSGQKDTLIQRGINTTIIGITGAWLIFLYPLLAWFVIGTLSARGFQDKVQKFEDNGEKYSVFRITKLANQLKEIQADEEQARLKLNEFEAREADLKRKHSEARQKYDEIAGEGDKVYARLKTKVRFAESKVKKQDDLSDRPLLERSQSFADREPEIKDVLAKIQQIEPEIEGAYRTIRYTERELGQVGLDKRVWEDMLDSARERYANFFEKEKAGDIVSELEYMETFKFNVFATMPGQLLTILLTLSMGSLGSLIYITRDYFRTREKPFSWYLFRPFLGMVTAVAIFILVKAGQITISDVGVADGVEENLNPFFISFLAIISGLLSEQAIERIRTAGISIFRGEARDEGQQDRWAVGLKAAIEAQNKNITDLAPYVDAPLETVMAWANEDEAVPPEKQSIIASWMNVPVRQLFTDLKPAQRTEAEREPKQPEPKKA